MGNGGVFPSFPTQLPTVGFCPLWAIAHSGDCGMWENMWAVRPQWGEWETIVGSKFTNFIDLLRIHKIKVDQSYSETSLQVDLVLSNSFSRIF